MPYAEKSATRKLLEKLQPGKRVVSQYKYLLQQWQV